VFSVPVVLALMAVLVVIAGVRSPVELPSATGDADGAPDTCPSLVAFPLDSRIPDLAFVSDLLRSLTAMDRRRADLGETEDLDGEEKSLDGEVADVAVRLSLSVVGVLRPIRGLSGVPVLTLPTSIIDFGVLGSFGSLGVFDSSGALDSLGVPGLLGVLGVLGVRGALSVVDGSAV